MNSKRYLAGMLVAASFMLTTAPVNLNAAAASSSAPSKWALNEIKEALEARLVPSWVDGKYRTKITRVQYAEMAVLLYERLTGQALPEPKKNPFSDTRSYYVVQAYELGIVSGTSRTTFSPDAWITREQIAVLLYNTLLKAQLNDRLQTSGIPQFADGQKIASWSEEAVGILAASNIITGSRQEDRTWFMPQQTTTVEEAAVMLNRVYQQFGASVVNNEAELLRAVEQGRSFVIKNERTKQVYAKAQEIISRLIKPGMSDYEKELAIHDYLVLNIAYDYDNYSNNTVPEASYEIYGALLKGIAVCQGYANAAKLLLNMAGIEAHVVTGLAKGELHAWNKVKLDGEYYNLDVTWDDPAPDVAGRIDYGYFNVSDSQLRKDHSWEDDLPQASATKHNYYNVNGLVVRSKAEFEARLSEAIETRLKLVTLKRTYSDNADITGLREFIFGYSHVDKFVYSFGSDGVITISFNYR
ncbi:transglutaminase domain-containing protein [Paenibacillus sp. GCM10027626]|uniref:transglutaminase domain-containing protein n=1 Tax=Paenibacillus sp. GCM10027626 TaxID=3273411 RepID=UPI003627ECFA